MQTHIETQTNTATAPKIESAPSLYAMAKDALAQHGNDTDRAEEHLFEVLTNTPSLLRSLVRGAVKTAVVENVTRVVGNQRRTVFDHAAAAKAGRSRSEALAKGVESMLLDMPLADGTRLRDATKFEVLESADRYQKLADTNGHRARWLLAIADVIPDGRRVGDVIDERKAFELYSNAA
jgi:hypothetical protein